MVEFVIHTGDCLTVMPTMDADSVDAVICDPPYGLLFMGKDWDHGVPGEHFWREALRVAKPGAHLLAFGGTRTFHRLACAIEDAGWEIRDCIMWVYASGFPKSHDVSKAIDKDAGCVRDRVPGGQGGHNNVLGSRKSGEAISGEAISGEAISGEACQWQGWGTALKPAWEPIIVARKPFRGTVAENVLAHGTGAINVDGCRVGTSGARNNGSTIGTANSNSIGYFKPTVRCDYGKGRWPANFVHDGSEEVTALFPNDAARFFYCAKASKRDRDEGCEGMEAARGGSLNMRTDAHSQANGMDTGPRRNHHPTVKPTDLIRYLCRLVTPPSGVILDPFMGSGSTGKAAMLEGFRFVGIELDPEYAKIAQARIVNGRERSELL